MIYRTLNERKTLDPSLQSLRFSRTAREAGWHDAEYDDDAPTGGAWVWGVVCLFSAIALLMWIST